MMHLVILSFQFLAQWRTLAILLALLNLKVLPLAWHIHLFYGFFTHYYFDQRPVSRSTLTSLTLVEPTIHTSVVPLRELDYNLHKSNGTYFTDLDIGRGHHVYCLFRVGVNKYGSLKSSTLTTGSAGSAKPPPAEHFIMALGGVTCTFKRELKPYRKYEIWTRALSWDEKWVYVISHIVKPGSANATAYTDQPWKKSGTGDRSSSRKKTVSISAGCSDPVRKSAKFAQPSSSASTSSTVHPGIYAVSIAKYAFKQGRLTIPPTVFLQACDLLPPSPAVSSGNMVDAPTPTRDAPLSSSVDLDTSVPDLRRTTVPPKESVVGGDGGRDGLWQALEARRMQHLGLAKHMAGLDEGLGLFTVMKLLRLRDTELRSCR